MTKRLAIIIAAAALFAAGAADAQTPPGAGFYELSSYVYGSQNGTTCLLQEGEGGTQPYAFEFTHFYYAGPGQPGSQFYYLNSPGSSADIAELPTAPASGTTNWAGHMKWTLDPVNFTAPGIVTTFDFTMTFIGANLFFINGDFEQPTNNGTSTCTAFVGYTAVRTGR